jgi:hypothetical protein
MERLPAPVALGPARPPRHPIGSSRARRAAAFVITVPVPSAFILGILLSCLGGA